MSDIVFVKNNCILALGGQRHNVRAGEPWHADDPLVKAYPDSFVANLPAARSTQDPRGYRELEVERATAAPGEKRMTRQRRDKSVEDAE